MTAHGLDSIITVIVIQNLHGVNVIQLPTMDFKYEPCFVPLTSHTSAVSHMTGIEIELLDRTLKIPQVQGHPVVFGQKEKRITYSI